jgi:hypothetical protein
VGAAGPAKRIAETVLRVTRRASASIAVGMRPVVAGTTGDDSVSGRAVLARHESRFPLVVARG